jgi:hypothetical protein
MKGILSDINLSSKGYKSSFFGFSGNPILLAMDKRGILLHFDEFKQVWHIHSLSSTDFKFVKYIFTLGDADVLKVLTLTTESQNQV